MSLTLDTLHDDVPDPLRHEIAAFLETAEGSPYPADSWLRRMQHWWTTNPALDAHPLRGWVQRDDHRRVIGFMAAIPSWSSWQGRRIPMICPASWRVAQEHRGTSVQMLLKLRELKRTVGMVDSTPGPIVRPLLEKIGFSSLEAGTGHVFMTGRLLGPLAALAGGIRGGYPPLQPQRRLVFDVAEVAAIERPFMRADRVEKWIDLDYLRWTQNAPCLRPRFIGVVDQQGTLSSYLMLQEHELKGRPAWLVVDWFTTSEVMNEVLAALGQICFRPALLGDTRRFIEIMALGPTSAWREAPALVRVNRPSKLYFSLPPALQNAERRSVLLDGDYGM
ncbi:MAG: hypothetical protein NTY98_05185 [Verrucomicrobia bacterium]|nr:hypothetical protein [Verrucomicrobiota bacterium]